MDLAAFVSRGQVDVDAFVDPASAKARGDAGRYKAHYQAICVNCHGRNGQAQDSIRALGDAARDNPWKALRILDMDIVVGIIAYLQTLPADVVVHSY